MTEIPPREVTLYSLSPALSPQDFEQRRRLNRKAQGRERVLRVGVPLGIGALVVLLVISDFVPAWSSFWREHQAVTSLVTGAVLTLAAVFVLDRVLTARSRRRWRSLGLMVCQKLEWVEIEETLVMEVQEFAKRRTGSYIKEMVDYLDLLPEALDDPKTWASTEDALSMEEWLKKEKQEFEEVLTTWAPVLIAEPSLAAIADAATDLLTTITHINGALWLEEPKGPGEGKWDVNTERWRRLLAAIHSHRYARSRMQDLISAYRKEV
jgi:hypothetical protein